VRISNFIKILKKRTNKKAVNKTIQHFMHKVIAGRKQHDQEVEEGGTVPG
jgi:hypothetical protein